MTASSNPDSTRTETIRSPALFLKEITVTEKESSRGHHRLSGTRLKARFFPFLHWVIRHTSVSLALVPMRLLVWLAHALYLWPNNPLRLSCTCICRIAQRRGYRHTPYRLYRQFLANALAVIENFFYLHHYGIERVADRVALGSDDSRVMRALVEKHGGVVLAVAHNIASAFSSLKLNQAFPLLVVARNSPTIARTKITLDFFERMQVPILMVRDGNRFQLSRTLFSVLRSGMVAAATLDNIDSSDRQVPVEMFEQQLGLTNWAAKIAARMQLPVVPAWFRSSGRDVSIVVGEPLLSADIEAAVQHYAAFFERNILEDPASWAYLADKNWRRILQRASEQHGTS